MELCDLCEESGDRKYIIIMNDKNGRIEIQGCKPCTDDLWIRIKQLDGREKMTNEKKCDLLGLDITKFKITIFRK